MPKFIYTAKNITTGESRGGDTVAKDERELAWRLREEGFLLTSAKQMDEAASGVSVQFMDRFQSVPLKERMIFARNLSVMISSGLTLSRSLSNLIAQMKNKYFQKILAQIFEDVQGGKTLSESLARYPNVFSELFVNMVYVGEISGNLDKVLDILAIQLEKEHDLLSKVKGALTYPTVVVVAMIGIAILMLTYILPKILSVFKDMNVELPAMTVFVITLSDFFRAHYIFIPSFFIGMLVFLKFFLKTASGKRSLSFVTVRTPIIKNIIIKVNCARFARIYSALLKSGVSVVDALNIVSRTLSNVYYKDALTEGVAAIQKGTDLSDVIAAHPRIFPILVPQMIEVGEETGKTEVVLEKLAEFYEAEVDQITKNLSSIIEPILMLLIGGMVGFFAVAMMQPMYSVLENIK
ncbi:MAG: type II secretion system F family protein [Candidatus Moranbacteria bacterium]|nr:type II secretion system F family protein [Candidatus Moranbacteria bacterium]